MRKGKRQLQKLNAQAETNYGAYAVTFSPSGKQMLSRDVDGKIQTIEVSLDEMPKAMADVNYCHKLFRERYDG